MEKSVPADADWTPLIRGGKNGLCIAIMALSWWVDAVNAPDSHLLASIGDVKWVLSELVTTMSLTTADGNKRLGEPSNDEPRSKR